MDVLGGIREASRILLQHPALSLEGARDGDPLLEPLAPRGAQAVHALHEDVGARVAFQAGETTGRISE
eukprot:4020839-Pyramimonas_sp.AAC.1